MPGPDTVALSWTAATDNSTSTANLQYEVVMDTATPITSLTQAEAASPIVSWTPNITNASVPIANWDFTAPPPQIPNSEHSIAVLVKDLAGNISMYPVVNRKVGLFDIVAVVGSGGGAAAGTHVFLNDGNASFSIPAGAQAGVFGVASSGYTNLALGNLTNHAASSDGGPVISDIFVTNNNVSPNEVWQNSGSMTFTQVSQTWPTAPTAAVVLGPIYNVAGEVDAFVANSGAVNTVWQDSSGNGVFVSASQANLSFASATTGAAAAMGNISGTGGSSADIFLANNGQTNQVWQDLAGAGTYSGYTEPSLASKDYTRGVAVADLNGDGAPDAFVANYGASGAGEQNYVYLNSAGTYTFGSPISVGASNSPSTAVALGDLSGDGTIDAFVVNSGSPDTVWSNDGTGTFSQITETAFAGMTDQGTGVALADLNGDGILDAVVSSGGSNGRIRVWLGNGDGTFTEAAEPNIPSGDYVAVAIGRLR